MMGWILSLLGTGGFIAALVFIPGLWAKVLAGLKWLVDVICDHPREAIIAALVLWVAWERADAIHARQTTVAWKARWDSHIAADKRSITQAIQWKRDFDTTAAQLSTALKDKTHAEDLLNAALADNLRMRGPGRATAICGQRGDSGSGTGSGGNIAPGGTGDAPLAPVPDDEPMAILPWRELVERARFADDNRTEVMAWREWYAKTGALLRERKAQLPAPEFGK